MKRKKKRYILGKGYPWYSYPIRKDGTKISDKICSITLYNNNVKGLVDNPIVLNIRDTGAWKKYKLILEEI